MRRISSLVRIFLLVLSAVVALAGLDLLAGNRMWLARPSQPSPGPTPSPEAVSLNWQAWMRGDGPTPVPTLTLTPHPFPPEVTPPPLLSADYGMQAFLGWWKPYRSNHDL